MQYISVFGHLIKKAKKSPFKIAFEDVLGEKLSYFNLYLRSMVIGGVLKKKLGVVDRLGVFLPNTCGFPTIFYSLLSQNILPVILNYKSSSSVLISCCKTSLTFKILTSKKFEQKAELSGIIEDLKKNSIEVIYTEDLVGEISFLEKLMSIIRGLFSNFKEPKDNTPAAVLFTSGSESSPKAVVLSNYNLVSNVYQIIDRMKDINNKDIFFSSLPFFHSFGLIAGVLFPNIAGIKSYIYPNVLDYKKIPEYIKSTKSTIFFSANTFLQSYAKYADKEHFKTLRAIYAGAEKLTEETRIMYFEKFGVPVYQGYGITEASPAISMNVLGDHRIGSVGRPYENIKIRIEPVEGLSEGGKLLVKGPNVMLGYFLSSNPGVLVPSPDGWHDTGDVVSCDEDGYIYIIGRLKRFAKIGGEMVSLSAIESALSVFLPDHQFVALSRSYNKKGEFIVLVTTKHDFSLEDAQKYILQSGLNNLHIPKHVIHVENIPVLGTGKIDYVGCLKFLSLLDETKTDL